jgi:hypothetical protein
MAILKSGHSRQFSPDFLQKEKIMQVSKFSNGGFVVHKIPYGNGKISAWFDQDGILQDVERFDKNGRKTGQNIYKVMDYARVIGQRIHDAEMKN